MNLKEGRKNERTGNFGFVVGACVCVYITRYLDLFFGYGKAGGRMKKITTIQFQNAKIGIMVGLLLEGGSPFIYGVKINQRQIVEVTPVYTHNKITINATGSKRYVGTFEMVRVNSLPDGLFRKRRE